MDRKESQWPGKTDVFEKQDTFLIAVVQENGGIEVEGIVGIALVKY